MPRPSVLLAQPTLRCVRVDAAGPGVGQGGVEQRAQDGLDLVGVVGGRCRAALGAIPRRPPSSARTTATTWPVTSAERSDASQVTTGATQRGSTCPDPSRRRRSGRGPAVIRVRAIGDDGVDGHAVAAELHRRR